jgi:hypothetical protein
MGQFFSREKASISSTEQSEKPSKATRLHPTYESDLAEVISSSRSVFSDQPKPEKPLPSCFYNLQRVDDHKFQFDFQWASNDGAVIVVGIRNAELYPKDHQWDVEVVPEGGLLSNSAILDNKRQWDGMRLRAMLKDLNEGLWGRR